jgi:hypothetical protein
VTLAPRRTRRARPRRVLPLALAAIACAPPPARASEAPDGSEWRQIARLANAVVERESPPDVMPFVRVPGRRADDRPRAVFVHYFPFFQNSFDNRPAADDTWAKSFLDRNGEGGKWRAVGGMVRERPLPAAPAGVWPEPYWRDLDIAVDILRARRMGADGFGLDLVSTASGPAFNAQAWRQAKTICRAAAEVAPGFKIALEPDADVLAQASPQEIAGAVREMADCPAVARAPDGRLLLIPFAPEHRPAGFWQAVLADLRKAGLAVFFIPDAVSAGPVPEAVMNNPAARSVVDISDGLTDWGIRDMAHLGAQRTAALRHTRTAVWMQPVAPQDERPKVASFWESQNTEVFRASWAEAFRQDADYVHLITWNDYGESTEVGPSTGTQFMIYDLNRYFIDWYKAGMPPRITRDAIYYSHRTQIFDPAHPPGENAKPFKDFGPSPVRNRVEMVALLTSPAEIEIRIGGVAERQARGPGLAVLTMDAQPGRPVFRILRDDRVVVETVSDWSIDAAPPAANPVYFGGSSTRPFVTAAAPQNTNLDDPYFSRSMTDSAAKR